MRNRNPKIVHIFNPGSASLNLQCKKCGQIWAPSIKPQSGGKFYRGSWQCPKGCKAEDR